MGRSRKFGKEQMSFLAQKKIQLALFAADRISLTNMRLFQKSVYQSEIADILYNYIGDDQFAHEKGQNSTMAQHKRQPIFFTKLHYE